MSLACKAQFVAIDTETNAEDIRDGRGFALGVSLAYRGLDGEITALYLPFRHRGGANYNYPIFKESLQKILSTKSCVFHNAKFDLASLTTFGLDTRATRFYCTMLLAHQVSETEPVSKSLDSCGKFYLNDPGKRMKGTELEEFIKKFGWGRVKADLMVEYAAYDAHLTLRLFEALWRKVELEGTGENWWHRSRVTRLIMEMEANGILIDTNLCEKMTRMGELEMSRIRNQLGGLNPASPKDLEALLNGTLGLTPIKSPKTGRPSYDKKTMERYEELLSRSNDRTAQQILAFRGWQKSVSANYEPYVHLLSPDGRLRPNYKLHGTKTGRLSCESPNLQQIPKEGTKPWNGKMKQCFIPEPGYVLIEADYSQLELRLGAAYAQEVSLLEVFADSDRDVFTEMSKELGMSRNDTKTLTYTIQYGGGVTRIMDVFGVTKQRATAIINNFYETYPGFRKASRYAEHRVFTTGSIKLWSGRYRHFQFPRSEAYKAFNSVIQGGAADIVEHTMLRCWAAGLNNGECRMLLQIHDAIVFEVQKDKLDHYTTIIRQAMEDVTPDFGVKFRVSIKNFGG